MQGCCERWSDVASAVRGGHGRAGQWQARDADPLRALVRASIAPRLRMLERKSARSANALCCPSAGGDGCGRSASCMRAGRACCGRAEAPSRADMHARSPTRSHLALHATRSAGPAAALAGRPQRSGTSSVHYTARCAPPPARAGLPTHLSCFFLCDSASVSGFVSRLRSREHRSLARAP